MKEIVRGRRQAQEEGEREGGRRSRKIRLEDQRRAPGDTVSRSQEQRCAAFRLKEQELLTRHQAETLSLHAAQFGESGGLLYRVRRAVAELIGRAPGLRSMLGPIQRLTHLDPRERHALERAALASRYARESAEVERLKRANAVIERRENSAMEQRLRRQVRLVSELEETVKQEFNKAVHGPRQNTVKRSIEVCAAFNEKSFGVRNKHPDDGGEKGGGPKPKKEKPPCLRRNKCRRRSLRKIRTPREDRQRPSSS